MSLGVDLVAADVELDERRAAVLRDLARVDRIERRLDVLDVCGLRDAGDDVRDGGLELGSPARAVELWIRMLSAAGCLKPASRILSIRPDSPGPAVLGSTFLTPTAPPIPKATMTSASHPNVAVFQWSALQRPMRAARLECGCFARNMPVPPWLDDTSRASGRAAGRGVVGARVDSGSYPAMISVSSSSRRRAAGRVQYVRRRETARRPRAALRARRADRARRARGRARGRRSGTTSDARRRRRSWFAIPAAAVAPPPAARTPPLSLRRRRHRSGCWGLRSPSSTAGWSCSSSGIYVAGHGRLVPARQPPRRQAGAARPRRRRARLARPSSTTTPPHAPASSSSSRSCSRSPGWPASRCASEPSRRRPRERAPLRPSASARRRPGSRSPRSARGSRASCTTSWPTR